MSAHLSLVWVDTTNAKVSYGRGNLTSGSVTDFSITEIAEDTHADAPVVGGSCDLYPHYDSVYVVWISETEIGGIWYDAVFFSKSHDRGSTWTSPVLVTALLTGGHATSVRIKGDSVGRLVVALGEAASDTGTEYIRCAYSADDGASWTVTQPFSSLGKWLEFIDLEIDYSDNIYIAFSETFGDTLFYCIKSTDHGSSFSAPVLCSPGFDPAWGGSNTLALQVDPQNHLHFVAGGLWPFTPDWGVYHWISEDGGATWEGPPSSPSTHTVSDVAAAFYDSTKIAVSPDGLHAFWFDANNYLRYSHSSDWGETWSSSMPFWLNLGESSYFIGAAAAGYGGGILLYQFFKNSSREVRALISDTGSLIDSLICPYPPLSTSLQGSCRISLPSLAQTHFLLA